MGSYGISGVLMPDEAFSKAIVQGLRAQGRSLREIAGIARISESTLKQILKEKGRLTSPQLRRIETASGMSCGQVALLSIDDVDDDFKQLVDGWAKFREQHIAPKRVRQRA